MQQIVSNGNTYWKPTRPLQLNHGVGPNLNFNFPVVLANEVRRLAGKGPWVGGGTKEHYTFPNNAGTLTISFAHNNNTSIEARLLAPMTKKSDFDNGFRVIPINGVAGIDFLNASSVPLSSGGCVIIPPKPPKVKQILVYTDSFNVGDVTDKGAKRKFKRSKLKAKYRNPAITRVFVHDVKDASGGHTFFTNTTEGRYAGLAANHICDWAISTIKEAKDSDNGFFDFQYIGDMVEAGILGLDGNNKVVLADTFDAAEFQRMTGVIVGSPRTVTTGQAEWWAWHYRKVFNKRK